MKNTDLFALYVAIASLLIIAFLLLDNAAQKDAERWRVYDCVIAEAKHSEYSGNPYSREAWELFAPECAK